jgi:hypothetical protein
MIRLFAPRPLLLLNTENDPNCPFPAQNWHVEAAKQISIGQQIDFR